MIKSGLKWKDGGNVEGLARASQSLVLGKNLAKPIVKNAHAVHHFEDMDSILVLISRMAARIGPLDSHLQSLDTFGSHQRT